MKMINRLISITEGDITIDGTEREVARGHRAAARDRLRDPADRPVPAHDGRGQHRHRAAAARLGQGPHPRPRARAARARRPRPGRARQALPVAALRRPAPARRPRPRDGRRPAADADGRAVRRDRPDHPRAPAERLPAPAPRARARPSSSSRTTSTRRSRWATGSASCARAACSPSTTRRRRSSPRRPTSSWPSSSGADRGLKRLALRRLDEVDAAPGPGRQRRRAGDARARRRCATRCRSCSPRAAPASSSVGEDGSPTRLHDVRRGQPAALRVRRAQRVT